MKLKFAAISVVAVGTVIAATYALSQSEASEHIIATGAPVSHAVDITSFVYPITYGDNHASSKQYPVAALDNSGSYCFFDDQPLQNTSFNTGGHLIEATGFYVNNMFQLMLSQATINSNPRFATKDDSYDENKKISLFGFSDFTRMDFQVGEGNKAGLYSDSNQINCSYNEGTKTYSFTGNFSGFAYFGPSFQDVGLGTSVVIDKITLYYNC